MALGDREYSPNSRPDVSTIKAFIATNRQVSGQQPRIDPHPHVDHTPVPRELPIILESGIIPSSLSTRKQV